MKTILFSLITASLILLSCNKDDDCTPGTLETTIVGEWGVTTLGIPAGDVEFHANGELTDNDDALIAGEVGGVILDQKSYTVNSNSSFTLRAENGANFIEYDVDVISYTCDEIKIEVSGISATMKRK